LSVLNSTCDVNQKLRFHFWNLSFLLLYILKSPTLTECECDRVQRLEESRNFLIVKSGKTVYNVNIKYMIKIYGIIEVEA
jgi:hypothetical protein